MVKNTFPLSCLIVFWGPADLRLDAAADGIAFSPINPLEAAAFHRDRRPVQYRGDFVDCQSAEEPQFHNSAATGIDLGECREGLIGLIVIGQGEIFCGKLDGFPVNCGKSAQGVLHLKPQLSQNAIWDIHGILGNKEHTHPFRPDQFDDIFDLVQKRFTRLIKNQMSLVNKYDKLRKYFSHQLQQLLDHHEEQKGSYKKRFLIKRGTDYISVRSEDIRYFFATHKIVCLVEK